MARLSDSITYGNHSITGDVDVGGTLTIGGVVYQQVNLSGGSNVTISGTYPNLTISSSYVNTTYSAGTGLSLSGTQFNVDNPFNPSGSYVLLRAQATTKTDVGLSNIPNLTVTDADTANTIMQRNASGDTWARLFRSSYSTTNPNIAAIYTTQTIGGDYMRPSTPAQVKAALGLDYVQQETETVSVTTGQTTINLNTITVSSTSLPTVRVDGYYDTEVIKNFTVTNSTTITLGAGVQAAGQLTVTNYKIS